MSPYSYFYTSGSLGEPNEKFKLEHEPAGRVFPRNFEFSQTSTSVSKTYANIFLKTCEVECISEISIVSDYQSTTNHHSKATITLEGPIQKLSGNSAFSCSGTR